MSSKLRFANWIPIQMFSLPHQPEVNLCHVGDHAFNEPFFDHDIEVCLRHPFQLLFQQRIPLAELISAANGLEWQPTGFIFHSSRCGSTLVAQMLAQASNHRVISEPSIFEAALEYDLKADSNPQTSAFRAICCAMRPPSPQEFFIKFDSWHTVHLPLIRAAFPSVPWIFLYRDPIEVLASMQRYPCRRHLRQPLNLGETSQDTSTVQVLAAVFRAALQAHAPQLSRFVNYLQLPHFVIQELPKLFQYDCSEEHTASMTARAKYRGKTPDAMFSNDSRSKQQLVTPTLRAIGESELRPLYEEIELIRKST